MGGVTCQYYVILTQNGVILTQNDIILLRSGLFLYITGLYSMFLLRCMSWETNIWNSLSISVHGWTYMAK